MTTDTFRQALESLIPSKKYLPVRTLWRHILRIKGEGFWTAYRRRRLWPKILETPPIYTDPPTAACDLCVHLMCYQGDYLCAIWALKSFYHQTKRPYPLVIHVQGYSTPLLESRLRAHFPNARMIFQPEADRIVEAHLRDCNCVRLLNFRRAIPTVQKLTDFLTLATSRQVLIFDADVLFFQRPDELVADDANQDRRVLFQRDFLDAYTIPPARAKADFGIDLQPEINVGMVRLAPGMIDLTRCEEYLGHPEFADFEGHTEQTLWALEASRKGAVSYLSSKYLVSIEDDVDNATLTARHYAGPSRGLFTRQGIPYLIRSGFLRSLKKDCSGRTRATIKAGS